MADGPAPPGAPGGEQGIRLDPSVIKALAADSRREILRSLQGRRKTASELAKELGLQKATVAEHLKRLTEAGLVARLEDERLWVYHELTPTGRGLLEPGRSRVFLALSLVLIGLLAAVTVMGLYLYLVELPGGGVVALEPDVTSFHTARPVDFTIDKVTGLDPDPAHIESLNGATRARLLVSDDGDKWRLRSEGILPAGTYKLRFDDSDPRFDAPRLEVHRVHVTAPSAEWWRGLDGDLSLNVQAGGRPLDGILFLAPSGNNSATISERLPAVVEDGTTSIPAALLDRWTTGRQSLLFEADPHIGPVEADGDLVLVAPRPHVAPLTLVATRSDEVQLFLAARGGEAPERVPVLLDGVAVAPEPVSAHHLRVPIDADAPRLRMLTVGRLANVTLTVHPDLAIRVAIVDGPRWRLEVTDDTAPVAGLPVAIDGGPVGTTDAEGQLVVDIPPAGPHTLTLTTDTGAIDRTFQTVGWGFVERAPDLVIQVREENIVGRSVAVTFFNGDNATYETTLVGRSAQGWSASSTSVFAFSTATTRLNLYPPMGGELDLYATAPPYRPIIVANETEGNVGDGAPGATETTATTAPTSTPVVTPIEFGRTITQHYKISIPQQAPPPPHDDTDDEMPAPETLPDREEGPDDAGARTVLVVLAVVILVTSLYLLRGRYGR